MIRPPPRSTRTYTLFPLPTLCRSQRVPGHGRLAKAGAQRVMMSAEPIQLRAQIVQMSKIAYADGPSADLVLIGGANAPARGADLASATRILTQRIKVAVNWQG